MFMPKLKRAASIIIMSSLVIMLVAACGGDTSSEPPPVQATHTPLPPLGAISPPVEVTPTPASHNEATINSVEILLLELFPVQANAVVRGSLPSNCVTVEKIDQQRTNSNFLLMVTTSRLTDTMCVEQPQLFEETVALDVMGLPAGTYMVSANGVNSQSQAFTFVVDNVLPEEPAVTLVPATIRGVVWQDICHLAEDGSPLEGCIADDEGSYRSDGVFNTGEPWLGGVQVTLREEVCPGREAGFVVTLTGPDGGYLFTDLSPGSYCVLIDPTVEPNASILQTGGWTYPAPEVGSVTVTLAAGQSWTADFGWNSRLDQADVSGDTTCVDRAAYVTDVTIPDDTVLAPGEAFVKTWRVRNDGNCPWDSSYVLAFTGGEQMAGPASVPLPQVVQPGSEVDLSVSLAAPSSEGSYRGDWLLQNGTGITFGSQGDYPFYVQIIVRGPANTAPDPAESGDTGAAISGVVWRDYCGLLFDGSPTAGCVSNGAGGYRADGIFNNGEEAIPGVEVKLSPGECPGSDTVYAIAHTDTNGVYLFSGLQAGPHCIFIDPQFEPNRAILMPGTWTYPAPNAGKATVMVEANQTQTADFGWNYFPARR
jgi:hypothetical protein